MTTKENEKSKKRIFWYEDDAHSLEDYYKKLSQEYNVSIGAHKDLIEQKRDYSFHLVLLDLMIHENSFKYDSKEELVKNIVFNGINWAEIGVEFLRLLKEGKYESYGFPKDVPVIAVTAHVDSDIQGTVESLGVSDFLLKPISMDKLKISIEKALNPLNNSKD
jgi:response regulator RpfG family c-di-GMP phosphodiesterase